MTDLQADLLTTLACMSHEGREPDHAAMRVKVRAATPPPRRDYAAEPRPADRSPRGC